MPTVCLQEKARRKRAAALKALAGVAQGACSGFADDEMRAFYEGRYGLAPHRCTMKGGCPYSAAVRSSNSSS